MKVSYSVFVLLAALAATHCYPADKKDDKATLPDKDVDFVPIDESRPGPGFLPGGVLDIDAGDDGGFFGNPFSGNPFPSLLGSIEGLMARMRQQLSQILGRLPEKAGDSPFPELHLPNLGDIDLGKGNTTSVTKVIDGHKVTINETEYKQDGDNGAAFFKVRIIDVHPDSSEEVSTEKDAEAVSAPKRDREPVEDSLSNEIPKTKDNEELNFDNIETFDEADLVPPHNTRRSTEWNNIRSVESIEDNSIDAAPQPVRDLSNDIYVNQLLADSGAPTNPDAEVFNVNGHVASQYFPQPKSDRLVHLPLSYAYPQYGGAHVNYPTSDFEHMGFHNGPMPMFEPLPLPFYPPPMFQPMHPHYVKRNEPEYSLVKEQLDQGSSPVKSSEETSPSHSQLQSVSQSNNEQTTDKVASGLSNIEAVPVAPQAVAQESSLTSNAPEASAQQSLPVTKAQVPSTST